MTRTHPAPRRLRFDLPGDIQGLTRRVSAVERFLIDSGCRTQSAQQLAVATEEILGNILRHAWPGREPGQGAIEVCVVQQADAANVRLRTEDDGVAFDPTSFEPPDLSGSLDDRPVGGLGILLVRSLTDGQSYRRSAGRNIFEVTKRCPLAD